jgi:hypothetical protein
VVPLHLLVGSLIGWLQREQHEIIEYLRTESSRRSCTVGDRGSPMTNGAAWLFSVRVSDGGSWRRLRRL